MSNYSTATHGNLALKDNQATAFSLVIVEKPVPVIAVGSVISYRWQDTVMELPILAIKYDRWGRVSQYVTASVFPEFGVFSMIAASDTLHIQSISEPREISGKYWYLLAALEAAKQVANWMKLASRHRGMVFNSASLQAVETSHGFGFHSVVDSDFIEGDTVKYERRMAKAREWQAVYAGLIEMYKAAQ